MNSINQDIGSRMKRYELSTKQYLLPHLPTIIRIDGKAFHTYVKTIDANKPFCYQLHECMLQSALRCMGTVMQNVVLGYTQSDEISILLCDFPNLNTEQWFGGSIQKISSISASAITAFFNLQSNYFHTNIPAMFDARVFQLPYVEVNNYFVWRQQDASRNSIQMLARHHFSHKDCQGLNTSQLQDKLMKIDVNWNDLDTWKKRGSCVIKDQFSFNVDRKIPIFTQESYIDSQMPPNDY